MFGETIGLRRGVVALAPYDEHWAAIGAAAAATVDRLLAGFGASVEHVGSTAVPGLVAKPILDLVVALDAKPPLEVLQTRLAPGGYVFVEDYGLAGGQLFTLSENELVAVHLHVVNRREDQWYQYVAFRDWLRNHDDWRDRYYELKLELAARYPDDRLAYTDAKEAFVREVLACAGVPRT